MKVIKIIVILLVSVMAFSLIGGVIGDISDSDDNVIRNDNVSSGGGINIPSVELIKTFAYVDQPMSVFEPKINPSLMWVENASSDYKFENCEAYLHYQDFYFVSPEANNDVYLSFKGEEQFIITDDIKEFTVSFELYGATDCVYPAMRINSIFYDQYGMAVSNPIEALKLNVLHNENSGYVYPEFYSLYSDNTSYHYPLTDTANSATVEYVYKRTVLGSDTWEVTIYLNGKDLRDIYKEWNGYTEEDYLEHESIFGTITLANGSSFDSIRLYFADNSHFEESNAVGFHAFKITYKSL